MSWFNTSGLSTFAKSAISQAQKSIDKVLDIKEEESTNAAQAVKRNDPAGRLESRSSARDLSGKDYAEENSVQKEEDTFFKAFLGNDKRPRRQSTPKPNKPEENDRFKSQRSPKIKSSDGFEKKKLKSEGSNLLLSKSTDSLLEGKKFKSSKIASHETKHLFHSASSDSFLDKRNIGERENSEGNHSSNSDNTETNNHGSELSFNFSKTELQKKDSGDNSIGDNDQEKFQIETGVTSTKHSSLSNDDLDGNDLNTKEKTNKKEVKNDQNLSEQIEIDVGLSSLMNENGKQSKSNDVKNCAPSSVIHDTNFETASSEESDEACQPRNNQTEAVTLEEVKESLMSVSNSKEESLDEAVLTKEIPKYDDEVNIKLISDSDSSIGVHETPSELRDEGNNVSDLCNKLGNPEHVFESDLGLVNTQETIEHDSKEVNITENLHETPECEKSQTEFETPSVSIENSVFHPNEKLNEILDQKSKEPQLLNVDQSCKQEEVSQEPIQEISALQAVVNDESVSSLGVNDITDGSDSENNLRKEICRLQELVEARESKMVALSKENIDMQETVSILRNQLEQADQANCGDESMIIEMQDEFSKHMAETDGKLNKVIQERDNLKQELLERTEQLTKNADQMILDYTTTLKDKEQQVQDLLAEGEAMSKRELKSNNAVKKYRAKFKDLESKLEQSSNENTEKTAEFGRLKESLKEKTEQEKSLKDQIKKLEMITDHQEDEISKMKDQLDDSEDKLKGMQTNMECGYQEINRLNLENANRQSEAEEIQSLKLAREELKMKLVEQENSFKQERQIGMEQLESLRTSLTRIEQSSARREDNLQQEIKDFQQRLEDAETRNEELSQSIASASKPLLRQIANLQNSHHNQSINWERVEQNLNDRLASLQQQLALVAEKERSAVHFAMEMKSRIAGFEIQVSSLQKQKDELKNELTNTKETFKSSEENFKKEFSKFEAYQSSYRKAVEEMQNEKMFIENQLNEERAKYESELIKIANEDKARRQLIRQSSASIIQPVSKEARMDDVSEVDGIQANDIRSRTSSTSSSSNLMEGNSRNASTAVMEKMQTQLRQKDGEIRVFKEEIGTLQRTRASLAQELVNLSNLVEDLQDKVEKYENVKDNYQGLESRYNAVLQLYGEKVEETDELRMDLEDVKQLYKQQIQQLLGER